MLRLLPLSCALLLLTSCTDAEPPRALDGLWSRSEGACAMGAGVRFETDAVRVFFGRDDEVLLEKPHYKVEHRGRAARITVTYLPPAQPRREAPRGGRSVLVLERDADNWIRPVSHQFADKSTGGVTLRLGEEDLTHAFTLHLCAGAPTGRT